MPVLPDEVLIGYVSVMLVLFIMYGACPLVFYEWLKWRDRKKEREQ